MWLLPDFWFYCHGELNALGLGISLELLLHLPLTHGHRVNQAKYLAGRDELATVQLNTAILTNQQHGK